MQRTFSDSYLKGMCFRFPKIAYEIFVIAVVALTLSILNYA